MLQYLLNTTAIWLISLVLFDVFLRRESYHGYNRFYLLFTFLLGVLLPLWQWQEDSPLYNGKLEKPLERVMAVKQNIVTVTGPVSTKINWELYLEYLYLLCVIFSLVLLIAEVIKIIRLYQTGKRSREGSCIIIETGKNYSPFSIFNLVFVNTRTQFTIEEWNMLIAHEQMHGLLFHFIDVLLIQIARILFWFHPLVYVYQKNLMMLHEYQADKVSFKEPKFYGQFLVEQALLQTAPSISHSFNRSPIKNRIVMLTRKSSTASKIKMLIFVPLALICMLCFSKNIFSQKFEKNGNIVTYRENKFEMSTPVYDTMILVDPVDGHEIMKVVEKHPSPIKMNGNKIYNTDDFANPNLKLGTPANVKSGSDDYSVREYLMNNLKDELRQLPDMQYEITVDNVVLDETGKIVYFENGGISVYYKADSAKTDKPLQDKISKKITELLYDAPLHSFAIINGQTHVPYILTGVAFLHPFTIKNHKLIAE